MWGPIWCELAVMGLESQAVLAWVTKHFVTIFSKTCNNIGMNFIFVDFIDV